MQETAMSPQILKNWGINSCNVETFRRVRKMAKSDYWRRHICLSECNNSVPTGRIIVKFDIWVFFESRSKMLKFHENLTRITDTLHEAVFTFMTISRSVLLRMRNVSEKSCRKNQNTHFVFGNCFPKIVPFMR